MAATAVVLSILTQMGRSPWYAVLFAWNPLVVIETGGMGHVDIIGALCLLLAVRSIQASRGFFAAAYLALSAAVKPPVVLLAPFLARDIGVRRASVLVVLGALLAMLYVLPLTWQRGYAGWLHTSREYSTRWEANGSIYELIKATADESDGWSVERAKRRARLLATATILGTLAAAWLLRADLSHAGYWVMLGALLTAPVSYPWYLLWVLCFVPLLGGWCGLTGLVWSTTIATSYLLWRTPDWVLPAYILATEYVPVFAALAVELFGLASGPVASPAQPACRRTAAP
jgi:hypothetical protein